jgi:uncharacterized membrane protein YphA (DoxX/SURF4 family)
MSSRDHTPRSVVPDVPGRPPDVLAPAVTSELEPGLGSQPMVAATSRETRLAYASQIDQRVVELAAKWFEPAARIAIFIIYFWFGILKLVGLSPATPLATALTSHTIGMQYFTASFRALALYECLVGILILIPAMTRICFVLIIIHMGIVSSPLVIVANVAWTHPMVPTLASIVQRS